MATNAYIDYLGAELISRVDSAYVDNVSAEVLMIESGTVTNIDGMLMEVMMPDDDRVIILPDALYLQVRQY